MRKFRRGNRGFQLPPFVALTWTMLNSRAYMDLPFAAAKALPYFLGRVKIPNSNPERYIAEFRFSFPEARRLGFAKGTFSKVIKDLIAYGWIDPVARGGLRGFGKGYNVFRLSKRWEHFGADDFERIDWEAFLPIL